MNDQTRLTQPFKWIGSKARMRKHVLEIIATIPRKLYVEPFGGSASVFFGKAPENSVYNDKNGLLVNFFRKLRSDSDRAVISRLASFTPESRTYWYEMKEVCKAFQSGDKARLDSALDKANLAEYDAETAVAFAFFYRQNLSFGGTYDRASFGEALKPRSSSPYTNRVKKLDDFAGRITMCNITERDFRDCIEKHDDPETLFYCDPPYECDPSHDWYAGKWTSNDTNDLVSILCDVKGSAVLSCYDGDLYKPLLDAGYEKRDFTARSTIRQKYGDADSERTETIYWRHAGANEKTSAAATKRNLSRTLFDLEESRG